MKSKSASYFVDQSANKKPFNDVFRPNGGHCCFRNGRRWNVSSSAAAFATPESALENSGIVILADLFRVNDTQRLIIILSLLLFVFLHSKAWFLQPSYICKIDL